ncbi:MAG: hypothetical protein C0444_01290 [Microbacterium sp.]|nr:hypothetical protein [Microbacterium sp.]MBA4346246.1 hypothetical protein [Microbacterium sp.]
MALRSHAGPTLATLAGMSKYEFDVTVVTDEGGPDPELLKRFAVCMTYRLELLDERDNAYPAVGDSSYFLDSFEGKFAWELSDDELESNPPTGVYYDIEHVDPAEPAGSGRVTVTARIPV